MNITRRTALLGALAAPISVPLLADPARAAPAIRVGVLRFGTVSWELDVIRRHGLDAKHGIAVQPQEFASSQATQVALQAGGVDVIVADWLWVARQRASGADWTCVPFSNATGAVVAPPGSPVQTISDLKGRRLGVAGTPLDKSWLILRAYARRKLGFDPDTDVDRSFAPPPLLAEQAKAGRLDAVLTFWPFAAKAEAAGYRRVLAVEDAVHGLGITGEMPVTGYSFSAAWAAANRPAVAGFVAASREAQELMAKSDEEWRALGELTGAADAAELEQFKAYYRRGIPHASPEAQREAAARLFAVLAETGGAALVGPSTTLAQGIFWQPSP